MNISHRQLRLILRILHCLGAFLGIFVLIYECYFQHSKFYTLSYVCYFIVTGAILYLLFARQRPNYKFAYGTFYAMCFVTVLFLICYIHQAVTMVSDMTNQLINHIEQNQDLNPFIVMLIEHTECCSIDGKRHTNENFERFQIKYSTTCKYVDFIEAKSCSKYIRDQRNFTIFLSCTMTILRLIALLLLWKYIREEYKNISEESKNFSKDNGQRSTTTTTTATFNT